MSYEANLQAIKELAQEKWSIAFKVHNDEDSELDDEDVVFFAKNYNKFKKFSKMVQRQKPNNNGDNSSYKCYECNQTGHMKKDWPERNKDKKDFKRKLRDD